MNRSRIITKLFRAWSKVFIWIGIPIYLSCFISTTILFEKNDFAMEISELGDADEKETGEEEENEKTESEVDDHLIWSASDNFYRAKNSVSNLDECYQVHKIPREIETPPPEFI